MTARPATSSASAGQLQDKPEISWRTARMPKPAHPRTKDFYVYIFRVDGYPFYVGIGRDQRAHDRLRYVRSLAPAKLSEKSLSVRVMAALDEDKRTRITYSCTRLLLNRRQ